MFSSSLSDTTVVKLSLLLGNSILMFKKWHPCCSHVISPNLKHRSCTWLKSGVHLYCNDGDNGDVKDDHIQTTSPAHGLYVPFLGAGSAGPSCTTSTISPFFCDTDISSFPRSSKYKEAMCGADWNSLVFYLLKWLTASYFLSSSHSFHDLTCP